MACVPDPEPPVDQHPRASPAAHPGDAPVPVAGRDPWFDNAKMLLVTLVVVGHTWTLPAGDEVHRPDLQLALPVARAGVRHGHRLPLPHASPTAAGNLRRLVTTVLLPYLVFEGLFALFRVHVGGETLERLWLNPHWPMWYLAVLFVWRLATPALRRIPLRPARSTFAISLARRASSAIETVRHQPGSRAAAVLRAGAAGRAAAPRRCSGRTAGRVLGLVVLRRRASRSPRGSTGGSAASGSTTGPPTPTSTPAWLAGHGDPLRCCWPSGLGDGARRCSRGSPGAAAGSPALGAGSLVVYLFHGFFVKGAEYAGFADWAADKPVLSFVAGHPRSRSPSP